MRFMEKNKDIFGGQLLEPIWITFVEAFILLTGVVKKESTGFLASNWRQYKQGEMCFS